MAKLLIVDDEKNLRLVVRKEMTRQGHETDEAADGEAAWTMLEQQDYDVLLCDINMPRLDGIGLLRRTRERSQNPPEVIMLTGQATVETAIEAMKLGAYDYLTKPYRIAELSALVMQAAEKQQLKIDNQRLRAQIARTSVSLPDIVAESSEMKEALRLVRRVSPSDASVLITGESGVGKELIAQAIHRLSGRSDKPFIDLNCAALQDTLLESELFGHEAGAFSGARTRKLGLFEIADGGTLFLDEVMEMPMTLQSKLLRALETKTFFRVGGVKKVEVDVRVIAATNRDPEQAVHEGTFRADLMYRINSFEINIPPLRTRREDIEPLARHLLFKIAGQNAPEIAPNALEALRAFDWSGNVRQLRNCLERAVLLSDNGLITTRELPPEVVYRTEKPNFSVSYGSPTSNGAQFVPQRRHRTICETSNASRSSVPWKRPAGTAARPPKSSGSRRRHSIAGSANTNSTSDSAGLTIYDKKIPLLGHRHQAFGEVPFGRSRRREGLGRRTAALDGMRHLIRRGSRSVNLSRARQVIDSQWPGRPRRTACWRSDPAGDSERRGSQGQKLRFFSFGLDQERPEVVTDEQARDRRQSAAGSDVGEPCADRRYSSSVKDSRICREQIPPASTARQDGEIRYVPGSDRRNWRAARSPRRRA